MRTPRGEGEGEGEKRGRHVVHRNTHNPLLMKNFDSFLEKRVTEKCFYSWLEKHGCWLTGQLQIGETEKKTCSCAEEHDLRVPKLRTELGTRTALGHSRELLILCRQVPLVFKPYKKRTHLDRLDLPLPQGQI